MATVPFPGILSPDDIFTGNSAFVLDSGSNIWLVSESTASHTSLIFESTDNGGQFTQVAAIPNVGGSSFSFDPAVSIDLNNVLHIVGQATVSGEITLQYFTYATTTNTLLGPFTIDTGGLVGSDYDLVPLSNGNVYLVADLLTKTTETVSGFEINASGGIVTTDTIFSQLFGTGSRFGSISLVTPDGVSVEIYLCAIPKALTLTQSSPAQITLTLRSGSAVISPPTVLTTFEAIYVTDRMTVIPNGAERWLYQGYFTQTGLVVASLVGGVLLGNLAGISSTWNFQQFPGSVSQSLLQPVLSIGESSAVLTVIDGANPLNLGNGAPISLFNVSAPGNVTFSDTNLVPDPNFTANVWSFDVNSPLSSSTLPVVSGAGPSGVNAFVFTGTGSPEEFNFNTSPDITVTPGATYMLSGFIDATNVTNGTPTWDVFNVTDTVLYAGIGQQPGLSGTVSTTFVVPAGVTTVRVLCDTSDCTVASGQPLTFASPSLVEATVTPVWVLTPRTDFPFPALANFLRGTKSLLPSTLPWCFIGQQANGVASFYTGAIIPPFANIVPATVTGTLGVPISFSAASSFDINLNPLQFTWSLTDPTGLATLTFLGSSATVNLPLTAGPDAFTLTVTVSVQEIHNGSDFGPPSTASATITYPEIPPPTIATPTPIQAARNSVVTISPTVTSAPTVTLTFLWSQVGGTPVAITSLTTVEDLVINTAGAAVAGETLLFNLIVSDGINSPVEQIFQVVVAARAASGDTRNLSRAIRPGNIADRNTTETWPAPTSLGVLTDFVAVKRAPLIVGTGGSN